jgi:uncharacterized membrane protein YgdD (TMEM256/DUF423 family)
VKRIGEGMGPRWILLVAAISGFIGVSIGAFGAHGLPDQLKQAGFDDSKISKKLEQCEIGVRYQLVHAVAILAIGLSAASLDRRLLRAACGMFLTGTVLFSGGLYSLAFADLLGHWSIVPSGGLMFLIGWGFLAAASMSHTTRVK